MRRGCSGAEMAGGVYKNRHARRNGRSTNSGDECIGLLCCATDADSIGFATHTFIANIDIITARGAVLTGSNAQCDVVASSGVVQKRVVTDGRVACAGCIENEGLKPNGG